MLVSLASDMEDPVAARRHLQVVAGGRAQEQLHRGALWATWPRIALPALASRNRSACGGAAVPGSPPLRQDATAVQRHRLQCAGSRTSLFLRRQSCDNATCPVGPPWPKESAST